MDKFRKSFLFMSVISFFMLILGLVMEEILVEMYEEGVSIVFYLFFFEVDKEMFGSE